MPGRGPQTFKKRQKEQERKERQQEKMAKRLARKHEGGPQEDQSTVRGTNEDPQPLPVESDALSR